VLPDKYVYNSIADHAPQLRHTSSSVLRERDKNKADLQSLILQSSIFYAIFTIDLDGKITSWNSGSRYMFGFAADEILGKDAAVLFTPEDREVGIPLEEINTALREGRGIDERWHVRKDGRRFYAEGLLMPLQERGRPLGFLKIE